MESEEHRRGMARTVLVLVMLLLAAAPLPALADEGSPGLSPDAASAGDIEPLYDQPGLEDVSDLKEVIHGQLPGEGFGGQTAGVGDVDNDGYDDFIVLVPSRGHGVVYHGGPVLHEASLHPLMGTAFTLSPLSQVRPAGDIDRDGFDDVLITNPLFYLPTARAVGAVYVFYGSPSGLGEVPDQILLGEEKDMRLGSDVDALGDIDKDGYNDILVGAEGWNADTGLVRIYLGGQAGLQPSPAWEWHGEDEGDRFGHAVTGAGDIDADGWLDFAVGAPFATSGKGHGKVYVFYGASNVATITVGEKLEGKVLKSYFGLSIRLAGDVNFDGFSDLVISSPSEETPGHVNAGKVELYLGSEQGLVTNPRWTFKGESDDALLGFNIAFLGDMNRDGYDDVALGAPSHSDEGKTERGKVYVFFGDKGGFHNVPAMVEMGQHSGDKLSTGLAGAGDVDGDGFSDMLVGAPGVDTGSGVDVGELQIYRGSDITMPPLQTDAIEVVDPNEGDLMMVQYRHYLIRLSVTHRTGFEAVDVVDLHLDPAGDDVTFRFMAKSHNLIETNDPDNLASGIFIRVMESESYLDTYDVTIDVKLHWGFPSARPLSARLVAGADYGLRRSGTWDDLARVVDHLTMSTPLVVTGERQGLLESNGWVASGETITFSGAMVVYDLAGHGVTSETTYAPPTGSVLFVVRDDAGGVWSQPVQRDTRVSLSVVAPGQSRPDMTYTASIETPDGSKAFWYHQWVLNVDGTPVEFRNAEPEDIVSSRWSIARIEIYDPLGEGVEPASVEYRLDEAGDDEGFGPWREVSTVRTFPDMGFIIAEVEYPFPEGQNHIMWRARDLMGNGPAESAVYPIRVDLGSISFSSPTPVVGHWSSSDTVAVGITIENTQGNPIDTQNIRFRVSTSPGEYSDWQTLGSAPAGRVSRVTVQAYMRLAEGTNNYVQWMARDLERREYFTSSLQRVTIDLTGPEFSEPHPSEAVYLTSSKVVVSVTVSDALSGVDEGTIQYQVVGTDQWLDPSSRTHRGGSIECSAIVSLKEGVDNYVRWKAYDWTGHLSEAFQQRVRVDLSPPTFSDFRVVTGTPSTEPQVEVSILVDDNGVLDRVSGVDLSTLEYMVGNNGEYSEWMKPAIGLDPPVVPSQRVTVTITVVDGRENIIIWRVSDAAEPMATKGRNTAMSEPYRIVADLPEPKPKVPPVVEVLGPSKRQVIYGTAVFFDASTSYDPEGGLLTFVWVSDLDGVLGTSPRFSRHLTEGVHYITLTVTSEESGLSTQKRFELSVVPPQESAPPLSALWEQVALVAILACIIVALLLQRFRIREWEL